jgi:hypothetical protein
VGTYIDLTDEVTGGPEYPAAVHILGIRMPLVRETRFARHYCSNEPYLPYSQSHTVSRWVDGSASIVTLEMLKAEWASWSEEDQMEFCIQFDCLSYVDSDYAPEKPDLPAMIRFVIERGSPNVMNAISHAALRYLRRKEVFELMVGALRRCPIGGASNILQVIALTEKLAGERVIRDRLEAAWVHPSLWNDAPCPALNHPAVEALFCISLLLRYFSVLAAELESNVKELLSLSCIQNSRLCRGVLSKYFPSLDAPDMPPPVGKDSAKLPKKTGGLPPEDRPT